MTAIRLGDRLREFLKTCEGKDLSVKYLRDELKIDPATPAWDGIRVYMLNLVKEKILYNRIKFCKLGNIANSNGIVGATRNRPSVAVGLARARGQH